MNTTVLHHIFSAFRIARKNLLRYKLNFIVMIAIFIGAFTMTVSLGYRAGITKQLKRLIRDVYAGDMTVLSSQAQMESDPMPIQLSWEELMEQKESSLAKLSSISGIQSFSRRLVLTASAYGADEAKNEYITVIGLDAEKEKNFLFKNELRFSEGPSVRPLTGDIVYISKKTAADLGLSIGSDLYIFYVDNEGMLVPTVYTVGGVFNTIGFPGVLDSAAFVDYPAMINKFRDEHPWLTAINIYIDPGMTKTEKTEITRHVENDLPGTKVVMSRESGSFVQSIMNIIKLMMNVSNGILYLTIFLFAFSSLFIMVQNRQREVGIMKSFGFSSKEIFLLFLMEGACLGLIPAVIGCLLGLCGTIVLSIVGIPAFTEAMQYMFASDHLYFSIDPAGMLLIILTITCMTTLGAVFPVAHVVKLRPIEALT